MKATFILLATVAVITPIAAAHAQDDDIIVTARKRQESILKVPVVTTVITQKALEDQGLNTLSAISAHVPGLVIGSSLGALGAQANVRGIGASAINATVDQSVSLNIDGLPLSQGLAYAAGMFDVAQVEVLKGPQALFYGKNSPAGVISLRSADPTNELEVIARAGYEFEANERMAELVVSGPLSDTLKARIAGHYSDSDGYFRNEAVAAPGFGGRDPTFRNFAPDRNWMLRGTLLFNPIGSYNARLKVNYTNEKIRGSGAELQFADCPVGVTSTFGLPINNPEEDCKLDRKLRVAWFDPAVFVGIQNNGEPFFNLKQTFGTLEQNVDVADHVMLTSVSGLYDMKNLSLFSGSATSGIPLLGSVNDFTNRQYTEEVRLQSNFVDTPLNFMAGGFYQNAVFRNRLTGYGNTLIGLPAFINNVFNKVNIESYSFFGQLTYHLTDKLEVAAGARWTHEARHHEQVNYATFSGPIGPTTLLVPKISSSNLSPELTLTYTPNDDTTLFASFKKGYKSGSFNSSSYNSPTTDASFGDESVIGGEAGLKARLADRRMTFNVAGYYYRYKDLQVGATDRNDNGVIVTRTLNAASASVYGLEAEASYSPEFAEGLKVHVSGNWNHTRYDSFVNAPCGGAQTIAQGCNQIFDPNKLDPTTGLKGLYTAQDLSGKQLVRAPDFTINGGFDYEKPLGKSYKLSLGSNLYYSSSFFTQLQSQPNFRQSAFAKLDANLAFGPTNDAWEVALIGTNLNDKITAANCFIVNGRNSVLGGQVFGGPNSGPAGPDASGCLADRGRSVWIKLTLRPSAL